MKRKDSIGQKIIDQIAEDDSDREMNGSLEPYIDPEAIAEYLQLMNDFIKNSIPEEMTDMQIQRDMI